MVAEGVRVCVCEASRRQSTQSTAGWRIRDRNREWGIGIVWGGGSAHAQQTGCEHVTQGHAAPLSRSALPCSGCMAAVLCAHLQCRAHLPWLDSQLFYQLGSAPSWVWLAARFQGSALALLATDVLRSSRTASCHDRTRLLFAMPGLPLLVTNRDTHADRALFVLLPPFFVRFTSTWT